MPARIPHAERAGPRDIIADLLIIRACGRELATGRMIAVKVALAVLAKSVWNE
jgi:hypothetical protein